jgi:putative NADPH-quinone reductase
MKVLVVYAHPNPKSFNHAVLEKFVEGLQSKHEFFYNVVQIDPATREGYLQKAYSLGMER